MKLQQSLTFKHGVADAVRTIDDSQRQEGHMKVGAASLLPLPLSSCSCITTS